MDGDDDDNRSSLTGTIRQSLIPDYVINYLRGETPETLAQRKQQEQQQLEDETGLGIRAHLPIPSPMASPMPSPGFRRSDEPILRPNFSEKARGYGTGSNGQRGQRRVIVAHGWRAGVALHGFLALVIFVVGLVGFIVALVLPKGNGGSVTASEGLPMAVIFSSDSSSTGGASCSAARPVAWGLRAVLAVFTVALLAGAQYVFQVLSSPTRAEIDEAHMSRRWLDIGVPSIRNVIFFLRKRPSTVGGGGGGDARFRSVLALLVVAVAVVSSVLYGTLINIDLIAPLTPAAASAASPAYNVLLVTPDFMEGAPFSNSSSNNAGGLDRVTILQLQRLAANSKQSTLTNLTSTECLQAPKSSSTTSKMQSEIALFQIDDETSRLSSQYEAVLVVLTDSAVLALEATENPLVQTAPAGSAIVAAGSQNMNHGSMGSSSNSVFEIAKDGSGSEHPAFIINKTDVAFCLVQETTASATATDSTNDRATAVKCNVTVNTTLLTAIVGLNLVTVVCFGIVLLPRKTHRNPQHVPLVTLGDAVASFLREPDATTRGACLLSKKDVVQYGVWKSMIEVPRHPGQSADMSGQSAQLPENIMRPMFLSAAAASDDDVKGHNNDRNSGSYFWYRSVSMTRWLTGALAFWGFVGLALAALVVVLVGNRGLGAFGQMLPLEDAAVYGSFSSSSASTLPWTSTGILASLPQLGVAVLYLLSDAHLSAYFLSRESSLYVATHQHNRDEQLQQHCRRPLRVSSRPRGQQTTSLYLTLPQLWNWILLILFAGLVFVLGQSVVVQGIQTSAGEATQPRIVLLGFSGVGLVVLLALLLALALLVLGLSVRRTLPPNASMGRNPLTLPGGSCSAVISARCHPMPEDMTAEMMDNIDGDNSAPLPLWLRPLAWGSVPSYHHPYQGYNRRRDLIREGNRASSGLPVEEDGDEETMDSIVGHCTYSSGPLGPLDIARSYA